MRVRVRGREGKRRNRGRAEGEDDRGRKEEGRIEKRENGCRGS